MNITPHHLHWPHRLAGGLQLLLLTVLLWLRVDAHAHAQIHVGQHQADSHCVVTWLAQGQFSYIVPVGASVYYPAEIFPLPALPKMGSLPSEAHLLPFSCGPPVA